MFERPTRKLLKIASEVGDQCVAQCFIAAARTRAGPPVLAEASDAILNRAVKRTVFVGLKVRGIREMLVRVEPGFVERALRARHLDILRLCLSSPWAKLLSSRLGQQTARIDSEKEMSSKNYRVRIARGDQQFEAEGDKAFVLDMLRKYETESASDAVAITSSKPLKIKPDAAALASSKAVSPGEFIRQLGLKKHTDLVAAFGYYLEQHSGSKTFTPADINTCYYEAKMEPSNISQSIVQNIKRGYMMVAKGSKKVKGAKKSYTLTASGEAFVKTAGSKPAKTK